MTSERKVVYIRIIKGRKHYVVRDYTQTNDSGDYLYLDEERFRKIMKEEAAKPLLLTRSE